MSYILDALKRADAERERGAVPGLHAQSTPAAASPAPSPRKSRLWIALLAGVAALAVGALAWREAAQDAPQAAAEKPLGEPVVAQVERPPAPQPSSVVPTAPEAPVPPVALPPIPQVPVTQEKPRPRARAAEGDAAASAAASATPTAARPAPSEGESRLYSLAELPDAVRGQLPKLSIGGSSYSKEAASRFLIINGRLFREGDVVTPDLTIEEIKLKQAVLKFKQYRYTVSF